MEQNTVYNTKPRKNLVTNELKHLKGKTDVGIFLILRSLSPRTQTPMVPPKISFPMLYVPRISPWEGTY